MFTFGVVQDTPWAKPVPMPEPILTTESAPVCHLPFPMWGHTSAVVYSYMFVHIISFIV